MKQDTSLTLQHRRQRRPQLDNTLLIPADLCKRVESFISCITEQVETQIQTQCSECEESITVMLAVRDVLDDFVHTSSTPELQTRCVAKLTNMLRESRCNQQLQNKSQINKSKNNITVASSSIPVTEVPKGQPHRENICATNDSEMINIHNKEQESNFKKRFMQILATEWLFPFLLDCRVRYLHRALTSLFKSIYVVDTCIKKQFRDLFVELLISPLLHDHQEINSELALHFLNSLDGLSSTVMPLMPDVFSSTFTQILPVLSRVLHWMVCKRNSKLCDSSKNDSEGKVSNTQNIKNDSYNKSDINKTDINHTITESIKRGKDKLETISFTNDLVDNIDELRFCIRAVTTYVHRYLGEVRKVWEQTNQKERLQEEEKEEIEEEREQEETVSLCLHKQNKNNHQVLVKEKEDKKYNPKNVANKDVTDSVHLLLYSGLYMLCNQNLLKDILNAAGLLVASLLTIRTCDHSFIATVCYCTCAFANAEISCSVHDKDVISTTSQNSSSCSSCSQCTYNIYDELDAIIPVLTQIVCATNPSNALCALHEHDKNSVFSVFATLLTKVGRFALLKGIMSHLSTPLHEQVQNTCVLLRCSVIDVNLMSKNNRILHTREREEEEKSDVTAEKQSMQAQKHQCTLNGSDESSNYRCVTLFDIIIPAALNYCDALQEPEVRFMAIQTLDGAIRYLSSTFNFTLKMLSVKSKETRQEISQHQKQSSTLSEQELPEKEHNACKEEEMLESMLQLQAILSECCASWKTMYNVINKITDIVIELWDDGTQQVSGALYSTYSEILHVHQVILELNKVMQSFNNKELEVNDKESGNEISCNKDESSYAHFDIEYTLRHVCEMHDDRRGKYHALLGLMKIMPLDKFLQCVSWYYSGVDNHKNNNNNKYIDIQKGISDNKNNCEIKSNVGNRCLQKSKQQLQLHDTNTSTYNVNMYGLQKFVHMLLSSANNHKICSIAGEMFVSLMTQLRNLQSSPTACTPSENRDQINDNNNTNKINKIHDTTDKNELINVLQIESIGLMQPLCNVLLRSDASVKDNLSVCCSNVDCEEYLLDHAESQTRVSHIIVHFIVPLIKENKNFLDELLEMLLAPMSTTSSTVASSSLHKQTKTAAETNISHKMTESSSIDYCVVELLSRARSCGIDTAEYVRPSSSVFGIIKRSIHSLSFDLSLSALSLYTLGSRKVRCVSRLQCATMEQYIALHLHLGGDTAAQRAISEVYKKWLRRIHESLSTCYKPKSEGMKNNWNDKRKRTDVSDIRSTNATFDNNNNERLEVSMNAGNATCVKDVLNDRHTNRVTEDMNTIISESEWQLYKKMLLVHFTNMVQLFMENIGVCREVHEGLSVERRVLAISLYILTLNTLLQSSLLAHETTLQIIEKQNEQKEEEEQEIENLELYQYFPECLITVLVQDLHDGWSYCRHVAFDLLTLYCKNVPVLVLRNMCREMSLCKHWEEHKIVQLHGEQEKCKVKEIASVNMYEHFHHDNDDNSVNTHNVNEKDSICVQSDNVYRAIEVCKSKVQSAKTYRYAEGAVAEATLLYTYFAHTAYMSSRCDNRLLLELQRELHLTEDEINTRCAQMQSLRNIKEIFTYINDHPLHGLVSLSTSLLSLLFTLRDQEKGNNVKNKSRQCKADNTEVGDDDQPTNEMSKETKDNNKIETNVVLCEESNTFLRVCCHVIQTCVSFIGTESTPCLPTQKCDSNGDNNLEEMSEHSSSSSEAKEIATTVVVDCRGHVYDKEHPLQEFVMRGVVNNTWLAIRTCTEAIERAIQLCDITKLEFTVVEQVCSILLNSLLVTKHNGVMRCVRSSLKALCIALMRCDPADSRLHALPEMLLATLLGENGVASSDQNRMLRRSQGLPHAIIAILQSESTQLSNKLFSHCMWSLLRIAQSWHSTSESTTQNTSSQAEKANDLELVSQEKHWENEHVESHENVLCESMPSSTEIVNESACANALNVLKFIFEDKTFAQRVMSFLEEAFTTSCDGFGHRSWYIRNSSLMLFSAVLQRFICQPSNQDTTISSSSNNTSLYDIHKRTPRGLSFCYHQLYRYNESIPFDMANKASSSSQEEVISSVKAGVKEDARENEKNQETMKYSNDNEDINLTIFPIMQMLCMLTPDPPHRMSTITTPSPHTISSVIPVTISKKNSRDDRNIHNEVIDCEACTKHAQEISYGKQHGSSVNAETTSCNTSDFESVVLYCAASSNWLIRASSANALSSIVPVNNVVEVIGTNVAALLEEQQRRIYKKRWNYVNNTNANTDHKHIVDCHIYEQNQCENESNKLLSVNYNVVHGVLLQLHSFHTRYVGTLHKDRWHRVNNNNSNLTLANHVQLSIVKTILSHSQLVMYCASTCPVIMTEFCLLIADIIYFRFNYLRQNKEKNTKEEKVMHEESNFNNTDDAAAVIDRTATMQSDEMLEMLICLVLHTAAHQFKAAFQFSNTLQSHQYYEEEQHQQEELNEKDEEEVQPFAGRKAVIDSIALVLTVVMRVIPFSIQLTDSATRHAPNHEFTLVQGNSIMQNVLASWKNIIHAECRALHSRWTNCSHNLISSIVSCLIQNNNERGECANSLNTHNEVENDLNDNQKEKCEHVNDVQDILNNFLKYFDCNLIAISGELLTNVLQRETYKSSLNSNKLNNNATTVQMFTSTLEFMTNCIASEIAAKSTNRKANLLNTATSLSSPRMTLHSFSESSCTSLSLINSLLEELSQSMCSPCESKSNENMTNNDNSGYRLWHNTEVKSAALQYVAYVLVLSSQQYEYECVNNNDSKSVTKNISDVNCSLSISTKGNNTHHDNNEEEFVLRTALDKLMVLLRICSLPTQPLCLRRAALQTTHIIFSHYRTQIAFWFLLSDEVLQNESRSTNYESDEQCSVMSVGQEVWGLLTLLRLLFDDVHEIRIKTCVIVSHTLLQLYSPEDHTNVMLSLTALLESAIKWTKSIDYAQCRDYLLQQNYQLTEIATNDSNNNDVKQSEEGEDDDKEDNNDDDEENEGDEDNDVTHSVLFERESDNMFAEPTMITYILHKLFPELTDNIQAYRFTQLDIAYAAAKARLSANLMDE